LIIVFHLKRIHFTSVQIQAKPNRLWCSVADRSDWPSFGFVMKVH